MVNINSMGILMYLIPCFKQILQGHSSMLFLLFVKQALEKSAGTSNKIFFSILTFGEISKFHEIHNYIIIVPTKCTRLLKAQDIKILYFFCLCILSPYMFHPTWDIFRGRNAST
jgi:hypothetical protein